jgi:hypothetical protein
MNFDSIICRKYFDVYRNEIRVVKEVTEDMTMFLSLILTYLRYDIDLLFKKKMTRVSVS